MKPSCNYGKVLMSNFFPLAFLFAMLATFTLSSAQTNPIDSLKVSSSTQMQKSSTIEDTALIQRIVQQLQKERERKAETGYSRESVILVIIVLALLLAIFILNMTWSQRSDRVSYLGKMYQDTLEEIEYKRLEAKYQKKRDFGEYEREIESDGINCPIYPVRPDNLQFFYIDDRSGTRNPWEKDDGHGGLGTSWDRRPGGNKVSSKTDYYNQLTDSEKKIYDQEKLLVNDYYKQEKEYYIKLDKEVQRRYHFDITEAKKEAHTRARLAMDVDFSVLKGRGPEFILEFTALVVIIFAAVILGILKILDTQQIGTLLAAIAGYVLGRAAQKSSNPPTTSQPSNPPITPPPSNPPTVSKSGNPPITPPPSNPPTVSKSGNPSTQSHQGKV